VRVLSLACVSSRRCRVEQWRQRRQFGVINAQAMQHGRVRVVDAGGIAHGVVDDL
jgi:hypothetical protein